MRNYLLMKALWVHCSRPAGPAFDQELVAWGKDDEQLREVMQPQIDWQRSLHPDFTFTYHGPVQVYWEINKKNFAMVLNGSPDVSSKVPYSALENWVSTDLRFYMKPAPASPSDFFSAITGIKGTEPSPRKTWSHGH